MTSRERVQRAMHFQSVDKVPLRYYYCPVGYYEHGNKLNDLYASLPGDFEPYRRVPVPTPDPADFDTSGRYCSRMTDEWGVTWQYLIYGIAGIPCIRPISIPEEAAAYMPPEPPAVLDPVYAQAIASHKESGLYAMAGCGNLYEKMISLYGDENVLCDIVTDAPEIHILADRILEYDAALLERAVRAGADCVSFGDDYGSERALLMAPETWRKFFKPRLKKLFAPAVSAGLDVHFHSCGQIWDILGDLQEIGVTSIWPQLPAYNMKELADRCRELGLAVEIHTDRARTMTYGTPEDVRELVKREFDTFRMQDGGSWFYVEADNGFPYANLEALVETIAQYR